MPTVRGRARRGFRCVNAVACVVGWCGSLRVCLSRAADAVPVGPCSWLGYREKRPARLGKGSRLGSVGVTFRCRVRASDSALTSLYGHAEKSPLTAPGNP